MCAIVKRRARHEGQQSDPGLAEHGTVGTPEGLAYHRTQVVLSSRPEGQREELTEENRHFQVKASIFSIESYYNTLAELGVKWS